jgi:hypothetical protein
MARKLGGLQGAHSKATRKVGKSKIRGNTKGVTKVAGRPAGPTGAGRGKLRLAKFKGNTKGVSK